jgi:hypothetical protein
VQKFQTGYSIGHGSLVRATGRERPTTTRLFTKVQEPATHAAVTRLALQATCNRHHRHALARQGSHSKSFKGQLTQTGVIQLGTAQQQLLLTAMCRPHSGRDSPGSSRPEAIRLARPDSSGPDRGPEGPEAWPEGPEQPKGPDAWPDRGAESPEGPEGPEAWPDAWPDGPDSGPEQPDGTGAWPDGPDSWPDSARLARSVSSGGQQLPAAAAAGGAEKRSSSEEGRSAAMAPAAAAAATQCSVRF